MRAWTVVRAHLGYGIQHDAPADHVAELRRELAASRAATYLRQLLESDLPPTPAQRDELVGILSGDGR